MGQKVDINEVASFLNSIFAVPTEEKKPTGKVINNPGATDWDNLKKTFLNQQEAKGRPQKEFLKKVGAGYIPERSGGIDVGPVGLANEFIRKPEIANEKSNFLTQYIKSLKRIATDTAVKITGQPRSLEDRILPFLEANKENPLKAFSPATPEFDPYGREPLKRRGISKYVGDIATINERGQKVWPDLGGRKFTITPDGRLVQINA